MDTQALNNTFILLKRFSFPTGNTTKDAIAITRQSSLILVSLYTLMIGVIISQLWAFVVLLGVSFFMRKTHSHNCAAATAGIFNTQASPISVVMLVLSYVKPMKREIWYPLLWAGLAVLTVAASSSASILLPRLLQIGSAAPVNPSAVYVPTAVFRNNTEVDETTKGKVFALEVPGALRAAAQVGATPRNSVVVEQETSTSPGFVRVNYHYNLTAAEFGLQNIPGLAFYVNGSCYTEYGWLDSQDTFTDTYRLWNNSILMNVSTYDGGPPFAFFKPGPTPEQGLGNSSYAIAISSLHRFSYTPGTDPWYLTIRNNDPDRFDFVVDTGRPVLSCWETNVFHRQNKTSDVWDLTKLGPAFGSPQGNTSFLTDVLQLYLTQPMIVCLGVHLGRSALISSFSSALGVAFDANSSSIHRDLEYLVTASYVATRDIFAETTRFSQQGREGIPSLPYDSSISRAGTGDFIIVSPDIATLSVRTLIVVPAVTGGMVLVLFLVKRMTSPWRVAQALNATILYSHLQELARQEGDKVQKWDREGDVAFSTQETEAILVPEWKPKKGGFLWHRREETGASEADSLLSKQSNPESFSS